MFTENMMVRVCNAAPEEYRTCNGTTGEVFKVRVLKTKTKIVIRVNELVNADGTTTDMTTMSDDDRLLEVNAIHCEPINVQFETPSVGSYVKIKGNKHPMMVMSVDKYQMTLTDYVTGIELKSSVFAIVKQLKSLSLRHFNVKVSGKKAEKYIVGHKKYPLPRKYFDVKGFETKHHEVFSWFKDKKLGLQKFRSGKFNKFTDNSIEKKFNDRVFQAEKIGGVYTKPNFFSEMLASTYVDTICEDRQAGFPPVTNENHVGIEIECYTKLSHEDLAIKFGVAGLKNHVRLVRDGSLNENNLGTSVEIKVLTSESKKDSVLTKVINVLKSEEVKAVVGESCGLHVHLDMRNRKPEIVYENLFNMQKLALSMVSPSRRSNKYCRPVGNPSFESAIEELSERNNTHFDGLSLSSIGKHNTIEIRFHQGTVDFYEISNWINFWTSLCSEKEIDRNYRSIEKFELDFPSFPVLQYMKERVQKFVA